MAARGYRTSLKAKDNIRRPIRQTEELTYAIEVDPESGATKVVSESEDEGRLTGKLTRGVKITAQKLREKTATEAELKVGALKDFTSSLARIRSGSYREGSALLEKYKDDSLRSEAIKDAMFRGAIASADRGERVDDSILRKAGLSDARRDVVARKSRIVTRGTPLSGFEEADIATRGLIGGTARYAAGAAEAIAVTGLKNIRDASGQPPESAIDKFIAERRSREAREEQENFGLFNPLRRAGISVEDSDKEQLMKKAMYKEAHRAEQEVDSIYNRRHELSSIDTSAFEKGNKAFESGKRQDLIDAITQIDSENGKIKDRWNIVQDVRKLVLTPQNRDQLIHMERNESLGFGILGGTGAGKLSDETKKIAEVERNLKNSSNKLSAMSGVLRNKLRRMNAAIPAENTAPAKVDIVSPGGVSENTFSLSLIPNMLDNSKGKFKDILSRGDNQ